MIDVKSDAVSVWQFPTDAIGHVAASVYWRMEKTHPASGLLPSDILFLLYQLLETLLSSGCHPHPERALTYVRTERKFREKRIAGMVGRYLAGINPTITPEAIRAVGVEIVYQCKVCSLSQMNMYAQLVRQRLQANV